MIYEQISTSSPKCLDGNAGFGIVAQTSGMPQNIAQMLHSLSGYTHRFPAGNPQNPVVFLHCVRSGYHFLSRIADCGNDYSGRTNRIAHHIVIADVDARTVPFGPTDVFQRYSFANAWNQAPRSLTPIPNLPNIRTDVKVCKTWESKAGIGNAGWAGVLAERAEAGQTVNIVFKPGHNMLPLLDEAFSLLPAAVRWRISFSTYFMKTQEAADSPLRVRCILTDTEEEAYTKLPNVWNLDLRQRIPGIPQGKYVELAKTGQVAKTIPIPIAMPAASAPLPTAPDITPFALQEEPTAVPLKGRKILKRGEWRDTMGAKPQTNWNTVILCLMGLILIVLIFGFVLLFGIGQANSEKAVKQQEDTQQQMKDMRQSFEDKIADAQKQAKEDADKAAEKHKDTMVTLATVAKIQGRTVDIQTNIAYLQKQEYKDLQEKNKKLTAENTELKKEIKKTKAENGKQ